MYSVRRSTGVTLIELMVVVALVAILGSIAVASYRSYLLRANRTDARTALLRIRTAQEKFYIQNSQYANNITATPPAGLGLPATSENGYYTLAFTNATATTYTASATATGGQASDTSACRTFTIDQDGTRTPADSTGCWK